jgi:hypothetical protein
MAHAVSRACKNSRFIAHHAQKAGVKLARIFLDIYGCF